MAIIKPLQSIKLKNEDGEDTTYVVASAPAIVETTEPASMASFADGAAGIPVKSLLADINPVQNLNGQSAPYPAGGGKNKLPITATTSTVSGVTFTINADGTISTSGTASAGIVFNVCTETLDGTNMVLSGCPSGGSDSGYYMTARIGGAWSSVHDTGSGLSLYGTVDRVAIVVANGTNMNGKTFSPMVRANGTDPSYAPYSNIRPITGWTGMNVLRTGKNLLKVNTAASSDSVIASASDTTGEIGIADTTSIKWASPYIAYSDVVSGVEYTISVDVWKFGRLGGSTSPTTQPTQGVNLPSTSGGNGIANAINPNALTNTFTSYYTGRIYWYLCTDAGSANHQAFTFKPMLRLSTSASDFEVYNGTTYPISWADEAGTVYGGTLDVTNGKLVATVKYFLYSSVSSYGDYQGHKLFYADIPDYTTEAIKRMSAFIDSGVTLLSNMFTKTTGGTPQDMNDNQIRTQDGASITRFYFNYDSVADLTAFNAILAVTPLQIVAELATPKEFDIDPESISTILGTNNIWADTGDVEVAYCADTNMYIDKVIAAL